VVYRHGWGGGGATTHGVRGQRTFFLTSISERLTQYPLSVCFSGFIPYSGDGYAFLLPSKYNPSRERPFPNQDV